MNKRITSILLCFVMMFSMLATAVPALAAPASTCTFTVEADKSEAHRGETITFTVYMQQTGKQNTLEFTVVPPEGLTYVAHSATLGENIQDTMGFDEVAWTEQSMYCSGFGAYSYEGTDKLTLLTFKCTVDDDAAFKTYEFGLVDHWADDETYNTKNAVVVPATFSVVAVSPTTYNVAYDANGGSGAMNGGEVAENGTFTLDACGFTAPDGQQFKAWAIGSPTGEQKQPNEQVTITGDTTIYAIWENIPPQQPTTYTVTFDSNGGTGTMADVTGVSGEYTLPANGFTALNGMQFKAWAIGSVNGEQKQPDARITITGDTTIYAIWENIPPQQPTTYTVSFDSNGGSAVTAQTIEAGQKATKPADPTKSGYDFKGWTLNGSAYDFNSAVNGDITLVATWEQQQVQPTVYTVTFDSAGGSAVTAQNIEAGQKATKPTDPTKAGYDFKGWTLNGSAYDFNTAVNGDITLVATWEQQQVVPTTYTVTFDSAGGSAVTAQNIEAGQKVTKPADPTKNGFDFKGWTLNGSAYDFNTAVNGDITLVATWEQQQVVPTVYTVTFDSNGGSAVTAQSIEAGQKATKPADPTKSGYDFKGWTLNGSDYDFNTAVNGDITLVATWEQQPTGHTHDYGQGTLPNNWDATHHWKKCTDQACPDLAGSIKDKAPHADSDGDGRCDDCDVDLIKISFAPGEGTGTMAAVYVTLLPGSVSYDFTLPANGFTAPLGKWFKCWSVGGAEKAVGDKITVAANTTVTAVWAGNTYNPRPNYPIYINPTPSSSGQFTAAKTFDGGIGLSVAVTILSAAGGAWLAKKKED